MVDFIVSVTTAEERRLQEFITALRTRCKAYMNPKSEWYSEEFESEFRSKLLTHHCFMGSPLFQESFDSAFIAACLHAGHQVEQAPAGQRFWDVMIDGRRISLKSSKVGSLRDKTLHISKLTEAAWIQDCRTATSGTTTPSAYSENTAVRSMPSCNYGTSTLCVSMSLWKSRCPSSPRFSRSAGRTSRQTARPSTSPLVRIPHFTLKLDRSDAKITIANINKDLCLVHGTWQL